MASASAPAVSRPVNCALVSPRAAASASKKRRMRASSVVTKIVWFGSAGGLPSASSGCPSEPGAQGVMQALVRAVSDPRDAASSEAHAVRSISSCGSACRLKGRPGFALEALGGRW